jgi:hypothetical protein
LGTRFPEKFRPLEQLPRGATLKLDKGDITPMDPRLNPFAPGAGTPPPLLVGRGPLIDAFDVALQRAMADRPARSVIAYGLRGVGKTVLLNRLIEGARQIGAHSGSVEAPEDGTFVAAIAARIRRILLALDAMAAASDIMRRALSVFRSFTISFGIDLRVDVEPERGLGDSGDLRNDLEDVLVATGHAARERGTAVVLAIDELQYLQGTEFAALIMALHRTNQEGLPIVLVGAGLPSVLGLAGAAKSYAERLFDFHSIGRLAPVDAARAIVEPARELEIVFSDDAIERIIDATEGYPYFVQEWASRIWNAAPRSPITLIDVERAEPDIMADLDESFFRVRFERVTPAERKYLRIMADMGPGPYKSGDIASRYGARSSSEVAKLRDDLIKKGMIYSAKFGYADFSVPLFGDFMRRAS